MLKSFSLGLLLLLVPFIAHAQQTGSLRIQSQPWVKVYMKGELKGITDEKSGQLFLRDLPAGMLDLKLEKKGYLAQKASVEIKTAELTVYKTPGFQIDPNQIQYVVSNIKGVNTPFGCTLKPLKSEMLQILTGKSFNSGLWVEKSAEDSFCESFTILEEDIIIGLNENQNDDFQNARHLALTLLTAYQVNNIRQILIVRDSVLSAIQIAEPENVQPEIAKPAPKAAEPLLTRADEMPRPRKGIRDIQNRFRYPDQAKKEGVSGKVTIRFIVTEDGRATEMETLRNPGGGCDEEAKRVI